MRKEANKQSKFKHYIFTPIRILKKAKELYVKGLVDCAGRTGYGAGSPVQISHHRPAQTKSVNLNTSKAKGGEGQGEVPIINETRSLVTLTHGERNVGNEMGAVNVMHRQRQRQRIVGYNKYNRMKMMSYHTDEVRKMGRIDEDKPCYFEDDGLNDICKANLLYLYPRGRANVVNRRAQ